MLPVKLIFLVDCDCWVEIDLSILEIFQFSASICATDSVISLAFLMEDNEPKLNAISLGR